MSSHSITHMIGRDAASSFEVQGLLMLYKITLADGSMAHLFPTKEKALAVVFNDVTYHSHPITAEGFSWSPTQPDQMPFLQLSHRELPQDFAPDLDNVAGGTVERLITLAQECAPPIGTDGGSSFPPETWQIDRLESRDELVMQLALRPAANLQDEILPKRVVLRDICQHRYRRWDDVAQAFDYQDATCPYVGKSYFTLAGTKTDDAASDSCSLRLHSGCKKRFARDLPFFGFPGLAR